MSDRDQKFYEKEYVNTDKSVRQIAKEQGTYASKIYRELKSLGIEIKTKSEVQKDRLKKIPHPTAGKKRSDEDKRKIGEGVSNNWQTLTPEEVKERIKGNLLDFSTLPKHKQDEIRKKAHKKIKEAAKSGSKIEKFFHERLIEAGHLTDVHKELPLKEKLIVDILLIAHDIIVEVDGVSHYEPIWGEEKLVQQQNADREKNGILMSCGYTVVRFRLNHSNYNLTKMHRAFNIFNTTLEKLLENKERKPSVIYISD